MLVFKYIQHLIQRMHLKICTYTTLKELKTLVIIQTQRIYHLDFVPCMVSGLAFYLAQKYQPQMVQAMKLYYEDELARALAEDGSASSTHITPKTYIQEHNVKVRNR